MTSRAERIEILRKQIGMSIKEREIRDKEFHENLMSKKNKCKRCSQVKTNQEFGFKNKYEFYKNCTECRKYIPNTLEFKKLQKEKEIENKIFNENRVNENRIKELENEKPIIYENIYKVAEIDDKDLLNETKISNEYLEQLKTEIEMEKIVNENKVKINFDLNNEILIKKCKRDIYFIENEIKKYINETEIEEQNIEYLNGFNEIIKNRMETINCC